MRGCFSLIFNFVKAVIMTGVFVDEEEVEKSKINRSELAHTWPFDVPWTYYIIARQEASKIFIVVHSSFILSF